MAITINNVGTDQTILINHIIKLSTLPPKYPAKDPKITPKNKNNSPKNNSPKNQFKK